MDSNRFHQSSFMRNVTSTSSRQQREAAARDVELARWNRIGGSSNTYPNNNPNNNSTDA